MNALLSTIVYVPKKIGQYLISKTFMLKHKLPGRMRTKAIKKLEEFLALQENEDSFVR